MRICTYNGKIIEMQGSATPGTLTANAERAGIVWATEQEVIKGFRYYKQAAIAAFSISKR